MEAGIIRGVRVDPQRGSAELSGGGGQLPLAGSQEVKGQDHSVT